MTDETPRDTVSAITALLDETEKAHGEYESTELHGVYDEAWPEWYAQYAVDHGLGGFVGGEVPADELTRFLAMTWAQYERADPKPSESWAQYAARRIATELR